VCKIALCLFALGTVAGLAVASLCVPLVYAGDVEPFGASVATAALSAVCLVLNLEALGRRRVSKQEVA
jgi:uncharacterized membrane protein YfbV (UPF0208 family)